MMAHHKQTYLIILIMKGILAGDWSVLLPSDPICALVGSSVVLPCSYDYPHSSDESNTDGRLSAQTGGNEKGQEYKVLSEMWCLGDSRCITEKYVFHSAGIFLDPSYQKRVQYLGQPGTNNCSLRISDLKESDSGTYVFYLITNHTTEKMPPQAGIQLLVADSSTALAVSAGPSHVIRVGAPLSLACCSPAATLQSQYRWYTRKDTRVVHVGQVWNTKEVTSGESGSYYCQTQTGDKMQNSTVLAIDVQYPPRNTIISTWAAQTGHLVTLTCSSEANPPVYAYIWYQDAACLPTADKSFHQGTLTRAALIGKTSKLTSANITTEETGQHCCVARNRYGSQSYTTTLTGSRATSPSDSSGSKLVLILLTVGILLAVVATVAFLLIRRKKTARHQSYVLTGTTVTES